MTAFTVPLYDPQADALQTLHVAESALIPGVLVGSLRTALTTAEERGPPALHPVVLTIHFGPVADVDPDRLYGPLSAWLRSVAAALDHEAAGAPPVETSPS